MAVSRLHWIDSARGIAFLMVIYSHVGYCNSHLMKFFTPIFLTTFFFVSGYLTNESKPFFTFLEQRARTLLLPFFIFGLFNIVSAQVITFSGRHVSIVNDLLDFFVQIRGRNDDLWFIPCLFVSSIPFYFLVKQIKSTYKLLVCSTMLLVANAMLSAQPLPWHIQLIPYAMFYMATGYIFRKYEHMLDGAVNIFFVLVFLFTYIIIVQLHSSAVAYPVSFIPSIYIVDTLLLTLTGLLLIVFLSKYLSGKHLLLTFIGSNSLLYFALHGKANALLNKITGITLNFFSIGRSQWIDFSIGILITIAAAVILVVPVTFINRYLYYTVGRGFVFVHTNDPTTSLPS